jgi:hypothetical protein
MKRANERNTATSNDSRLGNVKKAQVDECHGRKPSRDECFIPLVLGFQISNAPKRHSLLTRDLCESGPWPLVSFAAKSSYCPAVQ